MDQDTAGLIAIAAAFDEAAQILRSPQAKQFLASLKAGLKKNDCPTFAKIVDELPGFVDQVVIEKAKL